jgi:hypothetical protein
MPCITSGEMLQSHEQPERTADDASTAELVRKALADMQELARAEVALAGKELGTEARGALFSSVVLSASIAAGVAAVALALAAVIVAFGGSVVVALCCAAGLLGVAGGAGLAVTFAQWPKHFLPGTRRRITRDISELKDHLT